MPQFRLCNFEVFNQTTNNAAVSPSDVDAYETKNKDETITLAEWGGLLGIYSSDTKTTQKAVKRPMETTQLNTTEPIIWNATSPK